MFIVSFYLSLLSFLLLFAIVLCEFIHKFDLIHIFSSADVVHFLDHKNKYTILKQIFENWMWETHHKMFESPNVKKKNTVARVRESETLWLYVWLWFAFEHLSLDSVYTRWKIFEHAIRLDHSINLYCC